MKELILERIQYASRQQCCKTHKRPLPLPLLEHEQSLPYMMITFIVIGKDSVSIYGMPRRMLDLETDEKADSSETS